MALGICAVGVDFNGDCFRGCRWLKAATQWEARSLLGRRPVRWDGVLCHGNDGRVELDGLVLEHKLPRLIPVVFLVGNICGASCTHQHRSEMMMFRRR